MNAIQCPQCGQPVRDNARFCQKCGAQMQTRAPAFALPRIFTRPASEQQMGAYRIVGAWQLDEAIYQVAGKGNGGRFLALPEPRPLPRGGLTKLRGMLHPNLARVWMEVKYRGTPFLIVNYVEGNRLDALAERLTEEQAIQLAQQFYLILNYMHANDWCLRVSGASHADALNRLKKAFTLNARGHLMLYDYALWEVLSGSRLVRFKRIRDDIFAGAEMLYEIVTRENLKRRIQKIEGRAQELPQVLMKAAQNAYATVEQICDDLSQLLPRESPGKTVPLTRVLPTGVTARLPRWHWIGLTDNGKARDHNEDSFRAYLVDDAGGFFAIADGMGGQAAGEVASQMVIQEIEQTARAEWTSLSRSAAPDEVRGFINAWVKQANRKIYDAAQAAQNNMGTTLTAAFAVNGQVYAANVGDSRTYLARNGELYPLTRDHSLVASLVQAGMLEPDAVYDHPQRNEIFRSLGGQGDVNVDVFEPVLLQAGDRLLLCSDGLWEMVREPQIKQILTEHSDPQAAGAELIRAANANGGDDNITVIIALLS